MDPIQEYMDKCRDAAATSDIEALCKYLPKLKRYLSIHQYNMAIGNFCKKAVSEHRYEVYNAIFHEATDLYPAAFDDIFSMLIADERLEELDLFFKTMAATGKKERAKNYQSEMLLEEAFYQKKFKLIDLAIKNGADIHITNMNGIADYLELAMGSGDRKMIDLLGHYNVKSELSVYLLTRSMNNMSSCNRKGVIDAMFENGYLKLDQHGRSLLSRIYQFSGYKSQPIKDDIRFVADKWDARTRYHKFPAVYKDTAKINNLKLRYNVYAGYNISCFHGLALADRFNEAVKMAKSENKVIELEDLFKRDSKGNTVIDILGAHNRLKDLDDPELWAKHRGLYQRMVSKTPKVYRDQFNVKAMKNTFALQDLYRFDASRSQIRRRPKK